MIKSYSVVPPVLLIKFFSQQEYFDEFIKGNIYCNTPEYYRMCKSEGVGDKNESCSHSYRQNRGDLIKPKLQISVNKEEWYELPDLTKSTLFSRGNYDVWLNCWYCIDIPKTYADCIKLKNDLEKVKTECGSNYVLLPWTKIDNFAEKLKNTSGLDVHHFRVSYSSLADDQGIDCKDQSYSYQNEYRFLISKEKNDKPHTFRVGDLSDVIMPNASFQVYDDDKGQIDFLFTKECIKIS